MAGGQAASSFVNGLMRGYDFADRIRGRKQAEEDRALAREDREANKAWLTEQQGQQRKDWARKDRTEAEEQSRRALEAIATKYPKGPETEGIDPDEFKADLKSAGIDYDKYTSPEMGKYLEVGEKVMRREIPMYDPEVASAIDFRFRDEISVNDGKPIGRDVQFEDGRVAPGRAIRESTKVAGVYPGRPDKDGKVKTVLLDLDITAKDPETGESYLWNEPPTKGRQVGNLDDDWIEIPIERFYQKMKGDALLRQALTAPEFSRLLESKYVEKGGKRGGLTVKPDRSAEKEDIEIRLGEQKIETEKARQGRLRSGGGSGGGSGGKLSADERLVKMFEDRQFAGEKDPQVRFSKAVDAARKFKRAGQSAKSNEERVDAWARLLKQGDKFNRMTEEQAVERARKMVKDIYGSEDTGLVGGEDAGIGGLGDIGTYLPDRGEYVTRDDAASEDYSDLWGD